MKHYEKLIELGCFSRGDLAGLLGNDATAASLLREYLKKGYIERVRTDLYTVISLETKQPVYSRYKIGTSLFRDATISHHSSFEMYGYANQVFNEVYIATVSRFPDFEYNGVSYHRVNLRYGTKTDPESDIRMTSIEQTVIDSISDFEKISGLEETIRCMMMIPYLNEKEMIDILSRRNNGYLWQKCGYVLSQMKDELNISGNFLDVCRSHLPGGRRGLEKNPVSPTIWDPEWKLFVPVNFGSIIRKGEIVSDAI